MGTDHGRRGQKKEIGPVAHVMRGERYYCSKYQHDGYQILLGMGPVLCGSLTPSVYACGFEEQKDEKDMVSTHDVSTIFLNL